MSKTKTYLFHERSSIFPLIEGEDFEGLVEDIRKFGQLEDGVLFKSKILDGRNRYRACTILNIPFKCKEYSGKMEPLDYIISQNLHRRHLNIAQRSEIGIILKEYESEKAKERIKLLGKIAPREENGKFQKVDGIDKKKSSRMKIKEEYGEGASSRIAAKKVKISRETLRKAERIKEVAEKDPEIKNEWEKAKSGNSSVDAVYKKVQIKETIEKLPLDLQTIIKKEEVKVKEAKKKEITYEPVITVKEAKEIAEIPKPELRKEAVKFITKQKKDQEMTKDYIMDVAKGKEKMPTKTLDLDMKIINQFAQIYKQVIMKMTKRLVDSYNEQTKIRLLKFMKESLMHLQKELNIKGEIIEIEKS